MFFHARSVILFLVCFPIGCFAIYASNKVSKALARGDTAAARIHAKNAKRLQVGGLLFAIVAGIGFLIYYFTTAKLQNR